MACSLPEHEGTWNVYGQPVDCPCGGYGFQQENKMDRYGNQFATRVGHNNGLSADVVQTPSGSFSLVVGGVVASPLFSSREEAIQGAEILLGQLGDSEGVEQEQDYPGDVLPTGWDSADHKAMYE